MSNTTLLICYEDFFDNLGKCRVITVTHGTSIGLSVGPALHLGTFGGLLREGQLRLVRGHAQTLGLPSVMGGGFVGWLMVCGRWDMGGGW